MDNRQPLVVVYRNKQSHDTRAHLILSSAYRASVIWSEQFSNHLFTHHFVIFYDTRLKSFHTFTHTYSLSSLNGTLVSNEMLSVCSPLQPFPYIKMGRATTKPLVTNLKVLSYNIWNTNQLEGERYDDRMERMREVV